MTELEVTRFDAPFAALEYAVLDGRMCALRFSTHLEDPLDVILKRRFGAIRERRVRRGPFDDALRSYFSKDYAALDDIPIDPGGTPFLAGVWTELRTVPAGRTLSYGGLARRVGNPRAVRAVARANAINPVALVIPCHRIIGADGTLWGYGGGLGLKEALLRHEDAYPLSRVRAPARASTS